MRLDDFIERLQELAKTVQPSYPVRFKDDTGSGDDILHTINRAEDEGDGVILST